MSIDNGNFDPNDPNCAAKLLDPCEEPKKKKEEEKKEEGGGETVTGTTETRTFTDTFMGTLSGPRHQAAAGLISNPSRSGFREATIIPHFLFAATRIDNLESVLYDYDTWHFYIEKALAGTPDHIQKNDLDNMRILLKKLWVSSNINGAEVRKDFFLDTAIDLVVPSISVEGLPTDTPGYNSKIESTVSAPGTLGTYAHPEEFDSTNNAWHSTLNLRFDNSPIEYMVAGDHNDNTAIPSNGNWLVKSFVDDVFQTPLPFNRREMNWVVNPSFSVVSINPVVNFFDETKTNHTVMHQRNLYRAHYGALNNTAPECIEEDRIQKFSSDSVAEMKRANESLKNTFDQYVEISINTSQGSPICTLMDEYQMDKYFLDMAADPEYSEERVIIRDQTLYGGFRADPRLGGQQTDAEGFNKTAIQILDFRPEPFYSSDNLSISKIKSQSLEFFENMEHEQYPLKYQYWNNPEFLRFTDTIRSQIFLNKIEGRFLTKEYLRSFGDIMSGVKAPSEIFGYKIHKHEVITGSINPEPIQEFYFADSDKVLTIDFVDTQVVPGKTYAYRIYSLNLVFGSDYNYKAPAFDSPFEPRQGFNGLSSGGHFLAFPVQTRAYVSIISAPYYEKIVVIEEKPPLSPQASFVPFNGVDNKMQILISSNFGEKEEHPIEILDSDKEIIQKMAQTQEERALFGEPLEYKTDSIPKKFQIFRRSTPPESYSDFRNSDYVKTEDTNFKTLLFVDDHNFLPNKDYYYMFRSIDRIGISNPSAVFKVRMVSYENGIFMDLSEYEMRPLSTPMVENMCFQRVLKIQPSSDQTTLVFPGYDLETRDGAMTAPFLHLTNIGIYDNIATMQKSDPLILWGKKFKIRLTSKHSGKKIDLNMRFNVEYSEKGKEVIEAPDSVCDPLPYTGYIYADPNDRELMQTLHEKYEQDREERARLEQELEEAFENADFFTRTGGLPLRGSSGRDTSAAIAEALERRRQEREQQEQEEQQEGDDNQEEMSDEDREEAVNRLLDYTSSGGSGYGRPYGT